MTDFVMPNPPAMLGTSWFLALILVTAAAIAAGAISGLLVRARDRDVQTETDQSTAIQDLKEDLRNCQIEKAACASLYVTRSQHDGQIIRLEEKLDALEGALTTRAEKRDFRINARLDAISWKLGIKEQTS